MRGRRAGIRRLAVAVLVVLPALLALPGTSSSAQPSKADLQAAKSKLSALNQRLSLLDEQYNAAVLAYQEAEDNKDQAKAEVERAQADAADARAALSDRAAQAYTGVGSEIDVLLGADSIGEFSDKLEFLNRLSQNDSDLALQAQAAGQRAQWAAQQYQQASEDAAAARDTINQKIGEINQGIDQQTALIDDIQKSLAEQRQERRAAARAAALEAAQQAPSPPSSSSGGDSGGTPGTVGSNPPPPSSSGAAGAIQAAKSVLGTPYVWGGASPSSGFDCSGLTMWAWGQVGVSLPHSSAAQYSVLPHVDRSQLQPGDLLFFYSPIHHVSMYLGGNSMIHAPHAGSTVKIDAVYWQYFVGAGRPG